MVDIDHGLLPSVYRCANAFALASTNERFGLVFLEAMASGLPVLHHDFPVTNWIVGSGGISLDMATHGFLSSILTKLMPRDWERIGQRGRKRVIEAFDTEIVVPQVIAMYEDAAVKARKS
jgi:glycosyltransferase involved in cell wall biosynthesis